MFSKSYSARALSSDAVGFVFIGIQSPILHDMGNRTLFCAKPVKLQMICIYSVSI